MLKTKPENIGLGPASSETNYYTGMNVLQMPGEQAEKNSYYKNKNILTIIYTYTYGIV